jgi:hypothetical protein
MEVYAKILPMAAEEHLQILCYGVVVWNEWREKNPEVIPDLREANLRAGRTWGSKSPGVLILPCLPACPTAFQQAA